MKSLFNKSENELVGHFIPYIIVKGGKSLADRAYHPSQIYQSRNTDNALEIDIEWYK